MLSLACRMEAQKREEELLKEKEAQEARLRALEEQVRQGKIRKQEEKRRKEEAERLAKEKEAALAAQRAEIERAKERERQLQLELERLDEESSSDDEGPVNITPEDSTPTQSQLLPTVTPAAPVSAPESEQAGSPEDTSSQAPPVDFKLETESKNPYFKITHQATDTQVVSSPPVPQPSFTSPKADVHSTNPFHRLAKQETSKPAFTGSAPLERKSRARPEADDDWSAAGSEFDSSDDDDDERPGGGSAKQLASILFGTMAPPRPLSAMDDKSPSKSSTPVQDSPVASLPVPESNGSLSAPAAPPPAASGPPTPAGAPDRSALLASIQKGKGLRKVQTNDRSTSSIAGRVLD